MNIFSKTITTFTVCKFLEEAVVSKNISNLLEKFGQECESIGGNIEYFYALAKRELDACRLLHEQEGEAASGPPANIVGGGGIAGMKPEDLAIPVEVQNRHIAKKSIFRRQKPNKYFNDKSNNY